MKNRIITMESLVEFCKSQKTFSFSAKETGHPLVVSTSAEFEYSPVNDENLMQVLLKACHVGLNRNGSYISEDTMTKALPSFANKPILAEIIKDENNEYDFGTHAMEMVEENGELVIRYIESPVGIIPETNNIHLEYDKEQDKTYVSVLGYIFVLYGNQAADIIQRKNGTKVSVELEINELEWDAKNNWLNIKDFTFEGVTLLGESVIEGMAGSRLDMADFSHYETFDYSKEINDMKSRLAMLEQRFDNNVLEEGGNEALNKFEELLAKYCKTVEDIDFEYEGLSDEELEAKFAEVFAENEPEPSTPSDGVGGTTEPTEPVEPNDNEGGTFNEGADGGEGGSTGQTEPSKNVVSLQEKISILTGLVRTAYEEADDEWYDVVVYDTYVIMIGYAHGLNYKQNYTYENDVYQLTGERVQVFPQFLTQEEINALESMKNDFEALKQFKAKYDEDELSKARTKLIEQERFDSIRDTKEFASIVKDIENYSVEELETKLKLVIADYAIENQTFSFNKQKGGKMFTIPSKSANTVTSKYGGIFSEK